MENTLKILLVVGLVAVATFLVIIIGDIIISALSNKGKKNAKNAKTADKSKNFGNYVYDESQNLNDNEKFRANDKDYLLNLDEEEEKHYDEAKAEKEKALALKDKGNDINWFSELAGSKNEESDLEKLERENEEKQEVKEEKIENEEVVDKKQKETTVNPFLFDDDEDEVIELNKTDSNVKPSSFTRHTYDEDDDKFLEGEQKFNFEDEEELITPKVNNENPTDEELIDFINSKALEEFENTKKFNLKDEESPIVETAFEEFDNEFEDMNFENEEIKEKDLLIQKLQEQLAQMQQEKEMNVIETAKIVEKIEPKQEVKIEPIPVKQETKQVEEIKPVGSKVQEAQRRERIMAEVQKQIAMNKIAEQEASYREELNSSKQEIKKLADEIIQLKEELLNAKNEMEAKVQSVQVQTPSVQTIQEVKPVTPVQPVIVEDDEDDEEEIVVPTPISIPSSNDPKLVELKTKLEALESQLRVVDKDLKAVKKEYLPIVKAQKHLEKNAPKLRAKEAQVAKLKTQLLKPKYANDAEKQAKLKEYSEILDNLKLTTKHSMEIIEYNRDNIVTLEKEHTSLTKQHNTISAKIKAIQDEIEKYNK